MSVQERVSWRSNGTTASRREPCAKCTLKLPHLSPINTNGVVVGPPSLPPLLVLALVPLPPPASGAALGPAERTWALGAGSAGAGAGAGASSCAGTCCSKPPSSTPHSASVRPGSRALPYNMRHAPPRLGSNALTLAVNTWRGSGTHLRVDKSVFSAGGSSNDGNKDHTNTHLHHIAWLHVHSNKGLGARKNRHTHAWENLGCCVVCGEYEADTK